MTTSFVQPNTLYIVATPIGNMADISARAIATLNSVDVICCEDTRHSARLMQEISCKTKLMSLHEHNESERSAAIVERLSAGQSIALISDAGTPLISDPGYVLVNAVSDAGLNIVPVPGPSAVITALSAAGLPTDRFSFEGFLPSKQGARLKKLEASSSRAETQIFYESSHRIQASLGDMQAAFGAERKIVIAREMTKTFETFLRGPIEQVLQQVEADHNQTKGEFVVIVAGNENQQDEASSHKEMALAKVLKPLLPPKQAAAAMVNVFGGNKKTYYELILSIDKE